MSLLRKCSVNKQYRSKQIYTIIMLLFISFFTSPKFLSQFITIILSNIWRAHLETKKNLPERKKK